MPEKDFEHQIAILKPHLKRVINNLPMSLNGVVHHLLLAAAPFFDKTKTVLCGTH